MGTALCPQKMKHGAGLGASTLSINPHPGPAESTAVAHSVEITGHNPLFFYLVP